MSEHQRHHGHSSHRHDNHNGKKRAEAQRCDQEIRKRLTKELKERRKVEDKESRNADEWNKAQELKKITQFVYDRERKRFALAQVERKWNATKAEQDAKKRKRDQILQEAWEREFDRWVEELNAADSYDSRYTGPDDDGVTWSRQSFVNINDEISKRHLSRCMPSLRKPDSRGAHCKDCEDKNEVGHF